jgi:hypothetical protein
MAVLRDRLVSALDRVAFARELELEPDSWQRDLLRSSSGRILLNAARQSGKSAMVATLSTHTALYEPESLILLLSPTLRQSQELFKKCLGFYRAAGRPVPPSSETALTLTLENGSRIVSLPGKDTVRGYSGVRLLAIDEAARVPDGLYASVRPMLAVSAGRLVALSTPYGTRGWWHEAWTAQEEPWERYEVPATECPRISPEFLAEEERVLGEWWYRQEYFCEFLDAETQAFRREDIDRTFSEEVEAWAL